MSSQLVLDCKATTAQLKRLAPVKLGARNSLPILECVYLEPADGQLWARRTDLDVTARVKLADGWPDGWGNGLAVNAKAFLAAFSGKGITALELCDASLLIHFGGFVTGLPLTHYDDAPGIPDTSIPLGEAESDVFKHAALHAAVAASTDPTRPQLCGVSLEFHADGELILTGMNGHRLHSLRIPYQDVHAKFQILPPAPFMASLARSKVLSGDRLSFTKNKGGTYFSITQPDSSFTCRTYDGPYPNYKRLIPSSPKLRATFDCATMMATLKSALTAADAQTGQVILSINLDGQLEASAEYDGRSFRAPVKAQLPDSQAYRSGFNAHYLLDALAMLGEGPVELLQDSGVLAAIIRKASATGTYEYPFALVMPWRLPE